MTNIDSILKGKDILKGKVMSLVTIWTKDPYSQTSGFSSSHV